jgi:glycosyltransferase involved in cell wall biosynthesis
MKVSIITVVLNNADTIGQAIESVLGQDYPEVEYIVIDGQSTDGTLDVIKSYGDKITQWVSSKDGGIYPAMNKGLKMATGQIIGILNADDVYASNKVISGIVSKMMETNSDTGYADLNYVTRNDLTKIVRYWRSGAFRKGSFKFGWMPPHPTFFVKKSVYEKFGVFDTTLRSAADYELMLRLLHKNQVSTCYWPHLAVNMRVGGESNKDVKNRIKANNEDALAWKKNDLKMPFFTRYLKPIRKIPQFILKKSR